MATIKKRGKSYLFRCYDGYDTQGRQIERTMTWTPPQGMSEKKAEKEAAVQKEALLAEARAHLINACVAYSEAYGEEVTDEDIKKLEQELIGMEKFLEKMMNMKRGDLDLSGLFGLFGF